MQVLNNNGPGGGTGRGTRRVPPPAAALGDHDEVTGHIYTSTACWHGLHLPSAGERPAVT